MVNAVSPASVGKAAGSSAQNRATASREQFLQILVQELTNQNPLDPIDNAQFLQQLVGLQTLEQTSALTDALHSFESFLQMSSAAGFIGRSMKGFDVDGQRVEGVVSKVVMEDGKVQLQVGDHRVDLKGVEEIL